PLLEVESLDELHRDVGHVLEAPAVDHLHDVLVAHHGGGAGLALEALDQLLVLGQVREQHLEHDLAVERLLDAAVDRGHSAAADLLVQLERPEVLLHSRHEVVSSAWTAVASSARRSRSMRCQMMAIATTASSSTANATISHSMSAPLDGRAGAAAPPAVARRASCESGGNSAVLSTSWRSARRGSPGSSPASRRAS